MKTLVASILLISVCAGYDVFRNDWEDWKAAHGKHYNSEEEEIMRQNTWEQSLQKVIDHNMKADQGIHTYRLGLNQFADMDTEEWNHVIRRTLRSVAQGSPCNATAQRTLLNEIPDSVDWRKKGAVTPVTDQGSLGASWTYSATGSLEGQNFIKNGRLVKLSEQNLADCATPDFSPYCEVGSVDCAFYYVMKNDGIDTEAGYPNSQHPDARCQYTLQARGATCSGCVDIPSGDENALLRAVATIGPISVNIDAGLTSFQLYKSGIYQDPSCNPTMLDHSALVVGYGTENGVDYWIVKNSWGKNWGEEGYIRILRNHNTCGIATRASYPVM